MRFHFVLLFWLASVGSVMAQSAIDAPDLPDSATLRKVIRKDMEALSSKAFWGRGYTREGDSKAAAFIQKRFQTLSRKVPGAEVKLQPFVFPVNIFPAKVEAKWGELRLKPGEDFLVDAGCPSVNSRFRTLIFDTTLLVGLRMQESDFVSTLTQDLALIVQQRHLRALRKSLASIAHQLGALVVLEPQKLTWSVSTTQDTLPILYVLAPKLAQMKAEPTPAYISIMAEATFKAEHQSQNVILTLPGSGASPDSTVYLTAHYDHLGSMGDKAWFPGANDNASGVAHLLYLAQYYASHPHRNTLVFVAFGGEEAGLIGSQYFVQQALKSNPESLDRIRCLLNLDLLSAGDKGATVVNATTFPQPYQALVSINDQGHQLPVLKPRGKASNSDHYYFGEAGVPALFMYTMGGTTHYHDVGDTVENCSLTHVRPVLDLLIRFVDRY